MRLILDVTSLHYGGIMFFDHPCPSASHLTIESRSCSIADSPGCQQYFLSFPVWNKHTKIDHLNHW